MPRPTLSLTEISPLTAGWDAAVDDNFGDIKTHLEGPFPLAKAFRATNPGDGTPDIATLTASNYEGCILYLTDPDTPSTNGHIVYSNGSVWMYSRTGTTVT